MAREFTTIGVVGLGTMGAGIAEVFARKGFLVVGVERDQQLLDRGRGLLQRSTDRAVKRGRLTVDEQGELLGRLTLTVSLSDLGDCDLVVEAVLEHLDLKQTIFRQLDEIVSARAVLATNTSSLSVTEIAAATSRPGRVIGMHFFNPAPVQQLVEVVSTVLTEPEVADDTRSLARSLGKNPVSVSDRAGFIANALLFGYLNRAMAMYESRYVSREDLDAAMKLGCGYPMGPLALLDLIGLDTAYEILNTMYRQGRNRLHAPVPLLRQLVSAGLLGRKTGRGFYTYEAAGSPAVVADAETPTAGSEPQLRRPVRRVGVVGSGARAASVVQAFTSAGFETAQVAWRAEDGTNSVENLEQLADADLVVEAISADLPATRALFESLGEISLPTAILATSSSFLSVIDLAVATSRPADVVGMHFVEAMASTIVVEVVSTVATAAEVRETVQAVGHEIGAYAVSCDDRAGFVVNALLVPYLNDAVRMVEARYATADDVDAAMKQGCALPMGPFEVLDALGTDVALAMQRLLFEELQEPGLAPAPLLEQFVTAGYLGEKAGRGFHDHSPQG
jgi:3-hydroxybutyryl-CoA dehydrogenase